MRLIDADKYPCKDCGSMDDWCKHTCGMLKEWLNTTAYDVDAVFDKVDWTGFISREEIINIVKRGGEGED